MLRAADEFEYNSKWSEDKRINAVLSNGEQYYNDRVHSKDKIIISNEDYEDGIACVNALKTSDLTRKFFCDDPFNEDIEILYQTKFKGENYGVPYRCMFDILVVDHKN